MTDWSGVANPVAPLAFSTYSRYSTGLTLRAMAAVSLTAMTWVANLAIYVPFAIPFAFPIARLWWCNGSTAASNADMGVYSAAGTKIVTAGSTAQSGASTPQYVTPTAITLYPGQYYFAVVCGGTTAAIEGSAHTAGNLRIAGCLQQAIGSTTLPATMTPAVVSNALFPYCGITQAASGF